MTNGDVTRLLEAAGGGDRQALERLYEHVYGELRQMAASGMRRERGGHTLQPTALVNEVYLRLAPGAGAWENRRHFLAPPPRRCAASWWITRARSSAEKRGAGLERVTLADLDVSAPEDGSRRAGGERCAGPPRRRKSRAWPEMVNLRFFAGMSIEDTAQRAGLVAGHGEARLGVRTRLAVRADREQQR